MPPTVTDCLTVVSSPLLSGGFHSKEYSSLSDGKRDFVDTEMKPCRVIVKGVYSEHAGSSARV